MYINAENAALNEEIPQLYPADRSVILFFHEIFWGDQ